MNRSASQSRNIESRPSPLWLDHCGNSYQPAVILTYEDWQSRLLAHSLLKVGRSGSGDVVHRRDAPTLPSGRDCQPAGRLLVALGQRRDLATMSHVVTSDAPCREPPETVLIGQDHCRMVSPPSRLFQQPARAYHSLLEPITIWWNRFEKTALREKHWWRFPKRAKCLSSALHDLVSRHSCTCKCCEKIGRL